MSRTIVARYRLPVADSCESDDLRIVHADLPALSALELWSEGVHVTSALAQAVKNERQRERLPSIWVDGWPVPATTWLEVRLRRIKDEQRRRRHVV